MKIAMLLTGNELMTGDTVDTNSSYVAQMLRDLGIVPERKLVVGDDLTLLTESIRDLASSADVLLVNGGLGPTVDDLTAQALAAAVEQPIERHPLAMKELQTWADKREFILTESNLKQADLPRNCEIIDNPHGSAVGFSYLWNRCLIVCTPGVPSELKPMMENHVLKRIRKHGGLSGTVKTTRYRLFGITESGLQDMINARFAEWPKQVEIGFRVQMPVIEVKITTREDTDHKLNAECSELFYNAFADYIIGVDSMRLSQALQQALLQTNHTLALAESCTGGYIASSLVAEAGSSAVFSAGLVTYSNQMKVDLLGVDEKLLESYGAVSEQVARAMQKGAIFRGKASMSLGITGIAGPTGGSTDKPVGTVWIAWGSKDKVSARKFFLPMTRIAFQRTAAAISMDLLRRELLGLPTDVDYFSELKRKKQHA